MHRPSTARVLGVLGGIFAAAAACGCGSAALGGAARPARMGALSSAGAARNQPLVVEWPAADLVRLETQSKRGIVVVRYEGQTIEVLDQCVVPGTYAYSGATPGEQTEIIKTADELHARIPMGVAKLEAALRSGDDLRVTMKVVGRRFVPPPA